MEFVRRMKEQFRKFYATLARHRAAPQPTKITFEKRPLFSKAAKPQQPQRRKPRGSPASRGPHSAPFVLVRVTENGRRVYHRCADRLSAITWLAGRDAMLEHINGYGQVTVRERENGARRIEAGKPFFGEKS